MAKFDKCKWQKLHLLPYFTSEPLPHLPPSPLPSPPPPPSLLLPSPLHPLSPSSLTPLHPPSFRGELILDPKMCKEVFQNDQMVLSL